MVFRSVMIGLTFTFLIFLEVLLRHEGKRHWERFDTFDNVPIMTKEDNELGWVNMPGAYRYSTSRDGSNVITITINEDLTRGAPTSGTGKREVWFFGGSFTHGWAVTDGEVFCDQVDDALSDHGYAIRNFGVPGYGTLQSFLLFERIMRICSNPPELVVYGFIDYHSDRNVATSAWLSLLARSASDQAWIKTPYARTDKEEGLAVFPPKGYVNWPLSKHSVLVHYVQERIGFARDKGLMAESRNVTIRLIQEWQERVEALDSRFMVMILYTFRPKDYYIDRFKKENILFMDCSNTTYPTPETTVPGDAHPNRLVHQEWAQCFLRKAPLDKKGM